MNSLTLLAGIGLVLAAIPALMIVNNLRWFRVPPVASGRRRLPLSVIIPARNEAANIVPAVEAVLASQGVEVEVIVVDDQSTDETPELVTQLSQTDGRVKLVSAPDLPPGWCGKQHACQVGADHASHERLVWIDADVRLAPEALAALSDYLDETGVKLVSGFPRESTGSLGEHLLIPLIHFVLLGFLPITRMRRSTHPAYAAGCGQFFVADRTAYRQSGGHAAIRNSLMDGITLPRSFRRAGFPTDVVDATPLAECRMYHGTQATWRGLAKNAVEGIAHPRRILPMTILLFGGQVMPAGLLFVTIHQPVPFTLSLMAVSLSLAVRAVMARRFRQSALGVLLHPLAILSLLLIQWTSLVRWLIGSKREWRGRSYQESPDSPAVVGPSPS